MNHTISFEVQLLQSGNYLLHLIIVLIPLFLLVTFAAELIRQYVTDEKIRGVLTT